MSATLSTGEKLTAPRLSPRRAARLVRLKRRLARARRGSNRRKRLMTVIARLTARATDARRDWLEKVSTDLARRFDIIRVEGLNPRAMTRSAKGTPDAPGRNVRQKAGLKRGILANGWGRLICVACAHTAIADVNAAINIAAGQAVTARGALQASAGAVNREPQLAAS